MIVKDEEANLPRALDSVAGVASEVIVVDTGSRDRSVEIARAHGATVGTFAWRDDFAAARNHALAMATGDWVLTLDADESLGDGFRTAWRETLGRTRADGLSIPVANLDDEGRVKLRASIVRLHRNGKGYRFEGIVHEQVATSILGAGGRIEEAPLELLHHGYTREENRRKHRRARNLAMLRRAHEAEPDDARHWHYLALELVLAEELDEARSLFERVLRERPDDALAGWSASLLTDLLMRQREPGLAWKAATFGAAVATGQVMSLLRLGKLAVREGDPVVAERCARALVALPPGQAFDIERREGAGAGLRSAAAWERGDRTSAVTVLADALAKDPGDALLAEQFVGTLERMHGPVRGAMEALKVRATPAVAAAVVGAMVRQGLHAQALDLARQAGVASLYVFHAQLRCGLTAEGTAALLQQGDAGLLHLVFWCLAQRDDAGLAAHLAVADDVVRALAEPLVNGTTAPARLRWKLLDQAAYWLTFREDAFVARLLAAMPCDDAERAGLAASLHLEAERTQDALRIALGHPDDARSREVLGAVAFAHGDMAGAAHFLVARASQPDAPVRVYVQAAAALRALGRPDEASRVVALGRAGRPLSLRLQEPS